MRRVGWNTLARPALTFWQWRFIPVFRCCRVYEYSCPAAHKPMRAFLWRAYRATRQRRLQKESPGCTPCWRLRRYQGSGSGRGFEEAWKRSGYDEIRRLSRRWIARLSRRSHCSCSSEFQNAEHEAVPIGRRSHADWDIRPCTGCSRRCPPSQKPVDKI